MVNNMKEILLNGGSISYSYKASKTSWITESKIAIITSGWENPHGTKIVIQSEVCGWKEFKLEEIDEAITYYKSIVFNKKNLWYMVPVVMMELIKQSIFFDMEIDADYKKIMKLRNKKIKENGSSITSIR